MQISDKKLGKFGNRHAEQIGKRHANLDEHRDRHQIGDISVKFL